MCLSPLPTQVEERLTGGSLLQIRDLVTNPGKRPQPMSTLIKQRRHHLWGSFFHLFILRFYSAEYIGLSDIPLLLVTQPDSQVPNVHSDQLAAAVTPAQVNVHLYIAHGDTTRLTGTKCPL